MLIVYIIVKTFKNFTFWNLEKPIVVTVCSCMCEQHWIYFGLFSVLLNNIHIKLASILRHV